MSNETPPPETNPSGDSGGLSALTTALSLYVEEVADDCRICRRHWETTGVFVAGAGLRLTRYFVHTKPVMSHLRRAACRLPGWRASPFWGGDGVRWESLLQAVVAEDAAADHGLVVRGVSWWGRPVLVRTFPQKEGLLALELTLPCVSRDLPESPLRRVADGLRCHSHLIPDGVAAAIDRSRMRQPGSCSVWAYLTRAMPQGLFASQCVLGSAEGN